MNRAERRREQQNQGKKEVDGKNISEWKKMDKNRVGYLTAEEKEREDQEQIEYLRKWKEKREKKREHRRGRGKTAIHAAGEILLLEMLGCVRWMKLEKQ